MSSGAPHHQQLISGTSATNGAQAFAGTVNGNVYYADSGARQSSGPPPKPCSSVPFRRDPDFIDRRNELGNILHQIDQRCSQEAGRAALVGLGGAGKSQLAIEYTHRVRERSPDTWVFWVHASNITRVETAYREIADAVALPGRQESTANLLKLVVKWLSDESNGRWLMVIDNADDLSMFVRREASDVEGPAIADLIPQSRNGAVLLTSRNTDVARAIIGRGKDIIPVGTMGKQEAVDLLQKKLDTAKDESTDLVAALDHVPLAITQAAAYIHRQPEITITDYLERLGQAEPRTQLLMHTAPDLWRDSKDQRASNSILATWQVSFDRIQAERPSTAELLSFMSYFNRQGIPPSILRAYTQQGSRQTGSGNSMGDTFDEDIATLNNFSLITRTGDGYAMHGLVQLATRAWLSTHGNEEQWWAKYLSAMAATFPTGEYENWATCRSLLPHIQSIREREPSESHCEDWAQVMINSGWYLWRQGLYSQAEQSLRQALRACELWLEETDPRTLWSVSLLGSVLRDQGRTKEAEVKTRRALAGREQRFGLAHPDTLVSVNNLALVLSDQGKYSESEEMNRRAVEMREKELGATHPETLVSLINLTTVLHDQGKYSEEEPIIRQCWVTCREELGPSHPWTLTTLNNLAELLRAQGNLTEAEATHRQGLAGSDKELGENHPDTLRSVANLALTLEEQGKYREAEPMSRRALAGYRKEFGENHVNTLSCMGTLATVLRCLGKYGEAEALNRRELAGYEKGGGAGHPYTLSSMSNLALLLKEMGDMEQALPLMESCVELRKEVLGLDHPVTADSIARLQRWRAEARNSEPVRPVSHHADTEVPRKGTVARLVSRFSKPSTSKTKRASR